MASHHHFHHHYHHQSVPPMPIAAAASTPTTTSCYCCCSTSSSISSHYPLPVDNLLHAMASHIHPPPSQPLSLHSPYLNPSYTTHYYPPEVHQRKQQSFRRHCQLEEEQKHPVITSLVRRIASLEASLRNRSSASCSIRDAAARIIQTHFRAFLVRRSQTLRQLKDLAFIKSAVNKLKSSLSEKSHFDPLSLSQKAMDLLVKLDSIEGDDPMIRDGQRSIYRELTRILEFVDGFLVKRPEISSRAVKNVKLGQTNKSRVFYVDRRELIKKIGGRLENTKERSSTLEESDEEAEELENHIISTHRKHGILQNGNGVLGEGDGRIPAKVKKSVSFAENGNVYRFFRPYRVRDASDNCNNIDEDDSVDDEGEIEDNICKKVEDFGLSFRETKDRDEEDEEQLYKISTGDKVSPKSQKTGRNSEFLRQDEDGSGFVFAAPLPVKMETRADLMNKRKTLKIVE